MYYYSGIQLIELAEESQRGKPGELVPWNQALIQGVLRADVCKYRPEVGKINFLKNPQKIM